MYRYLGWFALCLTGCFPSAGPCDENAALEVVYTNDGTPAFAGQAVMQLSCGNGGFCHSESGEGGIALEDRLGAPAGLGFDVGVVTTVEEACVAPECGDSMSSGFEACCRAASESAGGRRLASHQERILAHPGLILSQIQSGSMPPPGEALNRYRCQITPSATGCMMSGEDIGYDRIAADDVTATPLPTLLDEDQAAQAEAQEIVRNWLACGAPVVERTVEHRDLTNFTGFTVPSCERNCADVTWPSIYERILAPSCSSSACHDDEDPEGALDFSTQAIAYAQLFEQPAEGILCRRGSTTRLVPNDPDRSLLIAKVEALSSDDVCGGRMPRSGSPLSGQRLCALRQWVLLGATDEGACPDPSNTADPSCTPELAAARAMCGADPTTASTCVATTPCPNHL